MRPPFMPPLPLARLTNEISMVYMGLTNSEGSGGGRTWSMKGVCPDIGGFDAVQIFIRHANVSVDTNHKLVVAVTETCDQSTDVNRWRPVAGGVEYSSLNLADQYGWKTVPFSGVDNFTPPAAAVNTPVVYASDIIPLNSVPRADGAFPAFPAIIVRDLVTGAGAASSFSGTSAAMNTKTAANGGLILQSGWSAADYVTVIDNTGAKNPSGAQNGGCPVIGIKFFCKNVGIAMMGVGDSLTQNAGVVADLYSSFGLRTAAAISALGIPCGYINNGFATKTAEIFVPPAISGINLYRPNLVVCQGLSPIDTYGTDALTRQTIQTQAELIQTMISATLKIGGGALVTSAVPMQSGTLPNASQDNYRKAYNRNVLLKSGVVSGLDFDSIVTDNGSPARISGSYDFGDHIHVNEAGVSLESVALTKAVKKMFGIQK